MKALVFAFTALLAISSFSVMASAQGRPFPGSVPHDDQHAPVRVVPGGGPMIHPPAPDRRSDEARQIYNALNVVQEDVTDGRIGARTMEKSVGGLRCKEVRTVGPASRFPKYSCELTQRMHRRNDARIYQALNVSAQRAQVQMYDRFGKPVTDRWGRPVFDRNSFADRKSVANLQCTETRGPRGFMQTTCTLF